MQFDQLGPYKIGKRLGRGGMGAVFEGVNIETGEPAAVKVLNPHLAEDEGFRERFEMEIDTLKKLRHPNIVKMYGYGQQQEHLYYAMELVKGHSVEEELQMGRRFTWREVVQDAVKLCKALRHAHDHGVIHRDLKPANLLLSEADNDIKLTDFGIARLFGNNRLTMDGALVGTAEYMSPEQAAGDRVTPQSDLYSLGGVMYAMLAGRPPFRTASLPEMLHKQRFEEPPPLSRFVTGVPPEVEEFISQLLSKDPQARASNALLLSRQLAAMEHGLSAIRQRPAEQSDAEDDNLPMTSPGVAKNGTVKINPSLPDARAATRIVDTPPPVGAYDPNASTMLAPAESFAGHPVSPPSNLGASTAPPAIAAPIKPQQPSPADSSRTAGGTGAESPAMKQSASLAAVVPPEPVPKATTIENRFTTVEEDERQRDELASSTDRRASLIQIGLLVCSLAMIVGLLWYFTRPPSAEKLFARIEAEVRDGDPSALAAAEDDVQSFLSRFPENPHAATVKRYQEEIDLQRVEQQFRVKVRMLGGDDELAPVERDYLEAMNWLPLDPHLTAEKLQALIALYTPASNSKTEMSENTAQCVELARRQLQQLREQAGKALPQYRALIDANLRRAEMLRQTSPAEAQTIWKSIITLYGDKPWAAAQVAKAKTALAEMSDSSIK